MSSPPFFDSCAQISVFKVVNKGYINKELSMYLMNAYEIKEIIVIFNLTQIIRIILVPSD